MGRKNKPHKKCKDCNKATANKSQICTHCLEKPKMGAPRKYTDEFIANVRNYYLLQKVTNNKSESELRKACALKFNLRPDQVSYVLYVVYKKIKGECFNDK